MVLDLEAAFDETNDHEGSAVIGMAGYLWLKDGGKDFSREWHPIPAEFGVSALHTTDCEAAQEEFKGWDRPHKEAFYARLIPLIDKYALTSIGVTMDRADYEGLVPENIKRAIEKPYFFCQLQCTLKILSRFPNGLGDGERIAFIFDRKNRALDSAKRHFDLIRAVLKPPYNKGIAGPLYEDDDLPLQAADFVAWRMACRRKMELREKMELRDRSAFIGWRDALYLPKGQTPPLREHLTAERLSGLVELVKRAPF
jgi:hypothetical protein